MTRTDLAPQHDQIAAMRGEGLPVSQIAKALNARAGAVKYYCVKHKIRGAGWMNSRSLAPYHDAIAQGRMAGLSSKEIAETINRDQGASLTAAKVNYYAARHELPRKLKRIDGRVAVGKLKLSHLTKAQREALERMAVEWKCDTLAEAAMEVLRDALEDALEDEKR